MYFNALSNTAPKKISRQNKKSGREVFIWTRTGNRCVGLSIGPLRSLLFGLNAQTALSPRYPAPGCRHGVRGLDRRAARASRCRAGPAPVPVEVDQGLRPGPGAGHGAARRGASLSPPPFTIIAGMRAWERLFSAIYCAAHDYERGRSQHLVGRGAVWFGCGAGPGGGRDRGPLDDLGVSLEALLQPLGRLLSRVDMLDAARHVNVQAVSVLLRR